MGVGVSVDVGVDIFCSSSELPLMSYAGEIRVVRADEGWTALHLQDATLLELSSSDIH